MRTDRLVLREAAEVLAEAGLVASVTVRDLETGRELAIDPDAAGTASGVTGTRVREVPDADRAEALLDAELAPGDVVLFKSSRDAGLRLLGDRLARPSEELT